MARLIPWCVAAAVLLAGALVVMAAPQPGARHATPAAVGYLPAADSAQHGPMDHEAPNHHHHPHLADHRGAKPPHSPAGLGDHHHHHHSHPHAADPHHHHPH